MSSSTNAENDSASSPSLPISAVAQQQQTPSLSNLGEDLQAKKENQALHRLRIEAASCQIINRLVFLSGLLCLGAGMLIWPSYHAVALLFFVTSLFLVILPRSKAPTRFQQRNLPKIASTQNPEALGLLCTAALCEDKNLRTVAETTLGNLIRFHLDSQNHRRLSETAALLQVLTHTQNLDLIAILLEWIVAASPREALQTLDRLAKSRLVLQNSALADTVAESRRAVIQARGSLHGRDDLLRAASPPSTQDLLRPAAPGAPLDHSHLLRPTDDKIPPTTS